MKNKIRSLSAICGLCASALILAGCSSTNTQQVVASTSGSGLRVKAAVPVTSAESVGLEIFVGKFNSTVAVQPTSSNAIHSANLVVAVSGRGKQTASGNIAGASTPTATGTNAVATSTSVAASPAAAIANGSSDTSFVALGDGYASQRMGTNEVTEANTKDAP